MNNSIKFNRKKARKITFLVIVFTILSLLVYQDLILDKIKAGDTEYSHKLLENTNQNMTIKKDKNYTRITLPTYITKIPSYEIPPNSLFARTSYLSIPFAMLTIFFLVLFSNYLEREKRIKIRVAIGVIWTFIFICAALIEKKDVDLIKEVAREYSSINNKDKEEFINIVEGKKIFKESTELIEITVSSNISNEKNSIEYAVNLVIPERVAIPYSVIKWKTSLIPVEDYFNYIRAYAENSGGKYIKNNNEMEILYKYKEESFNTKEDAKEYINKLGFSTDEYEKIIKEINAKNDITIKVPKTALATTETKLNELILKYVLEKENYDNIEVVPEGALWGINTQIMEGLE